MNYLLPRKWLRNVHHLPSAPMLAFSIILTGLSGGTASAATDPLHAWADGNDPVALEQWVDAHLAAAEKNLDKLLTEKGKRTIQNTVRPYDDAQNELAIAGNESNLLYKVGKPAALRDKAQALNRKVSSVVSKLNLNQGVYRALSAVPLPRKDAATRQY